MRMSRNSRGPARGLAALSLAVMWCAFGALTASAQDAAKPGPGSIPKVQGAPGSVSLPAGTTACPSSAAKPSSPTAACANTHPGVTPQSTQWSVTMSSYPSNGATDVYGQVIVTATANFNVGPTPYYIIIADVSTGAEVTICGTGTTCSTQIAHPEAAVRMFQATIALFSLSWPSTGNQAFSNGYMASWLGAADIYGYFADTPPGQFVVTAATSMDIGPTPYWIELFKWNGAQPILVAGPCGWGATCGRYPFDGDYYLAVVANYSTTWDGLSDIRAISLDTCNNC
jgi:hypothetical protein